VNRGYTSEIQPTMLRTVAWVQSLGFRTTDSGDGVINVEAGMEGALPVAHVVAVVDVGELITAAHHLLGACKAKGLHHLDDFGIEATYSPVDEVATLMLIGVSDAVLP